MKETLKTLSARLGLSPSTVSRAISGKAEQFRISEKTVALILEEARKTGFVPNKLAQGLRSKTTSTIGIVVPDLSNAFFGVLTHTIVSLLKSNGYQTLVVESREREEEEMTLVQAFVARNVNGLIVIPVGHDPTYLEHINEDIPVVLADRYFENSKLSYASTDNHLGGELAARCLMEAGYTRILSIQGNPLSMPNRMRFQGFSETLAKNPEIVHTVVGNSFSCENGYNSVMEMLGGGKKMDAIFTYSVTILQGAFHALRELGYRIPEDIGIIAYDDNSFYDYLNPPVTRVCQPLLTMGRMVVETLQIKIKEGTQDTVRLLAEPYLIKGKSC